MDNNTVSTVTVADMTTKLPEYDFGNLSNSVIESSNTTSDIEGTSFEPWVVVIHCLSIAELLMTVSELALVSFAATKYKRFRRNYRNQMLMQLSLVRVVKRAIMYVLFWTDDRYGNPSPLPLPGYWCTVLSFTQIYTDFVIVLLVLFFVKYMYDSLIIVIVKITPKRLCRTVLCAWLVPLPIAAVLTLVDVFVLTHWQLYLLVCCIFRWPLLVVGTQTYVTVLFKVMMDRGRKSVRGLAVTTFVLCVTINLYLFCRDVIELWCTKLTYITFTGLLGIVYNVLVLVVYVYLIAESTRRVSKKRCVHSYSVDFPTHYKVYHTDFPVQ